MYRHPHFNGKSETRHTAGEQSQSPAQAAALQDRATEPMSFRLPSDASEGRPICKLSQFD